MLPLFAYGTLADPQMLDRLLGRSARRKLAPALLPDYEKVWVAGFEYPFVVPRQGGQVAGQLIQGLGAADYTVLDDYEGVAEGDYRRERARVLLQGIGGWTEALDAFVYVLGPRWQAARRIGR